MPQSLSKVYLHIVFSKKLRVPYIKEGDREGLQAYLVGTISNMSSYVYELYANPDHVHILCTLPRTITIANFVSKIKSSSSKWMKTQGITKFSWQGGYAAFSVSSHDLDNVLLYIKHQPEHHRKSNFKDELRNFFRQYKVDFDEQYVWD